MAFGKEKQKLETNAEDENAVKVKPADAMTASDGRACGVCGSRWSRCFDCMWRWPSGVVNECRSNFCDLHDEGGNLQCLGCGMRSTQAGVIDAAGNLVPWRKPVI